MIDYEQKKEVNLINVVKRNYLRVLVTETISNPYRIYTVTNLSDKARALTMLSSFKINCNINCHNFVIGITDTSIKIGKVIFDSYRMQYSYVASNFTKPFYCP